MQLRRLRQEFEQVSLAQEKQIREVRAELDAERKGAPAAAPLPSVVAGGDAAAQIVVLQTELQRNSTCRRGVPPQPWPCFLILSLVQMPG